MFSEVNTSIITSSNITQTKYLDKKYPGFLEFAKKQHKWCETNKELIYCHEHKILHQPTCAVDGCNEFVKFTNKYSASCKKHRNESSKITRSNLKNSYIPINVNLSDSEAKEMLNCIGSFEGISSPKSLDKIYPGLYTYLKIDNKSIFQNAFDIKFNINKPILCDTCKINKVKFQNYSSGYSIFCSFKCARAKSAITKDNKYEHIIEKTYIKQDERSVYIERLNKIELEHLFSKKRILSSTGNVNTHMTLERLNKDYPEIYKVLINYSKNINVKSLHSILYHYINKIETVPLCLHCNRSETKLISIKTGYYKFCSNKCSANSNFKKNNMKNTCQEKYGIDNVYQSEECKQKIKATCVERYDETHHMKNNKILQKRRDTNLEKYGESEVLAVKEIRVKIEETNLQRYGNANIGKVPEVRQKIKATCEEKYNGPAPICSEEIKEKLRNTFFIRYDVNAAMQHPVFLLKQQNSAFKLKNYILPNGSIINVQGYEPQYLDWYFKNKGKVEDIEYDMTKIPVIHYLFKEKKAVYFPDFYIKSTNTIVEVKSTYTYEADLEINLLKKQASLDSGYNFLFYIMSQEGMLLEIK